MAFIEQLERVQGQTLDTIADTQKRALEVNGKVADALKDRVPPVKFPFAGVLPTPAQGIKLYFDFAGKLLAANRTFAEEFVGAWDVAPAKPVAKKAPAKTATKAAARKSA